MGKVILPNEGGIVNVIAGLLTAPGTASTFSPVNVDIHLEKKAG